MSYYFRKKSMEGNLIWKCCMNLERINFLSVKVFGCQLGKQLNWHSARKDLSPSKNKSKYWWNLFNYLDTWNFGYLCSYKKAFEGQSKRMYILADLTKENSVVPFRKSWEMFSNNVLALFLTYEIFCRPHPSQCMTEEVGIIWCLYFMHANTYVLPHWRPCLGFT